MSATSAAVRLSSAFKISCLGMKTIKRGVASRANRNSLNRVKNRKMLPLCKADEGEGSPQSSITSCGSYEEEFHSFPIGVRLTPRNKGRTRIDLDNHREHDIGNRTEASDSSIIELRNSGLPTSFGKKPSASRSRKIRQTQLELGGSMKSSMFHQGNDIDEPFDICLSETIELSSLESSVNESNCGIWNQKLQSTKESGHQKHNIHEKNKTDQLAHESAQVLRPGMVLLRHYIPLFEQVVGVIDYDDDIKQKIPWQYKVGIVKRCRELGIGPGGFYRPGFNNGAKLRLYMMCLGLDWNLQTKRYGKIRDYDQATPPDIPQEFVSIVSRALDDSYSILRRRFNTMDVAEMLPQISPNICIVNFYTTKGRLGLHQDRDESQESLQQGFPVVSISLGDSAEFLYGDQRDVDKAEKVLLQSGDVLIFGGESRLIFHGVSTIIPNTAPPALLENAKLLPGRLNLTFRKY